MKFNVEVDCSPEEARRFLGLPDVTSVNEAYVEKLTKAMQGAGLEQMQDYARQVAPMGELALKMFGQFMDSGADFGKAK